MNVRYRCPQMRLSARRRDAANAYCNNEGGAFGDNPKGWFSLGALRRCSSLTWNNQAALLSPSIAPKENQRYLTFIVNPL